MFFMLSGGKVGINYLWSETEKTDLAPPVQVAVVGGGPAGIAAVWKLSQEAKKGGKNIEITLFERKGRVGGRMQVEIDFGDSPLGDTFRMEDLATGNLWQDSIFATRARDIFGLKPCGDGQKKEEVGYWTGNGFASILTTPLHELSWVRWLGLVRHYGRLWFRSANRLHGTNRFGTFFGTDVTVATVGQLVEQAGMARAVHTDGHEQIISAGVAAEYVTEVLVPQTRRQLGGQHPKELSMFAINHATQLQDHPACANVDQVEGTLERFLGTTKAQVKLNTQVTKLERLLVRGDKDAWVVKSQADAQPLLDQAFDHVILTGPWNTTTIPGSIAQDPIYYRSIWVTYLTSPTKLQAPYFGAKDPVPDQILLIPSPTLPVLFSGIYEISHVRDFYGLNFDVQSVGYVYRVLSEYPISNETFAKFADVDRHQLVKVKEHLIENAYPLLFPRSKVNGNFELQEGLWYAGAIETIGSDFGLSWGVGENIGRLVFSRIKEAKLSKSQALSRSLAFGAISNTEKTTELLSKS
ncbi:hypothetical protein K3495_g3772 [Podosphaera aphanis]|nr:hypothetical protein K3495_g3772 [Podosphaera aphanis]